MVVNMQKLDLSLVPMDELLDEVSARSEFYVAAYQLINQSGPNKTIYTHWKNDAWFGNLALAEAVKADILHESYKHNDEDDD